MKQRGIALFGVMMVLILASLAVLASARTGLMHEMMTGHQADQLRAQAMADALVLDAESDILGDRPGKPCRPGTDPARSAAGFSGCRERGTESVAAAPYFPQSIDEFEEVRAMLQVGAAIPCRDGICAPSSLGALASLGEPGAPWTDVGARYGQFTQAAQAHGNASAGMGVRGWYWIEMFQFQSDSPSSPSTEGARPDTARPFVYRITALALGNKPGTRALVKTLFIPYPAHQLP